MFNPQTYLIEGRLVLNPTPDMIVWDGGGAYRVGQVWIGNGWREFPGGEAVVTSRMINTAPPATRARPRRSTIDTSDCEAALLMWRNY